MTESGYRNRIVGHGRERASQLLANPNNYRLHPEYQQKVLDGTLKRIGWIDEVIVNIRESGEWGVGDRGVHTIIDGHLRVVLALRGGEEEEVPVKYVDLGPEEEAIALATYDRITELAGMDIERFNELVAGIEYIEDDELQKMLQRIEVGEKVEDEFSEIEKIDGEYSCPKCGYEWSGKPR